MEVPWLGVKLELQTPTYTMTTATPDLRQVLDLHCSSWQRQILNPLSEARDRTRNLMDLVGFVTAEPRRELPAVTYRCLTTFFFPTQNAYIFWRVHHLFGTASQNT